MLTKGDEDKSVLFGDVWPWTERTLLFQGFIMDNPALSFMDVKCKFEVKERRREGNIEPSKAWKKNSSKRWANCFPVVTKITENPIKYIHDPLSTGSDRSSTKEASFP